MLPSLLPEGCICCTLHGEFEKSLREIREKYSPDLLMVETSGASEPFPVILSLQNLSCTIEGIICVVDSIWERYRLRNAFTGESIFEKVTIYRASGQRVSWLRTESHIWLITLSATGTLPLSNPMRGPLSSL